MFSPSATKAQVGQYFLELQMNALTKIINKTATSIDTNLEGWKVIDGNPCMKTWIEYTSPDKTMIAGYWEATAGTYHTTYSCWEFIHIIEGEVVITADGGEPQRFIAGDTLVIEADFIGQWEIKKKIFKHFVIKNQ